MSLPVRHCNLRGIRVLLSFLTFVGLLTQSLHADDQPKVSTQGPTYSDIPWEQAFDLNHIDAIVTDRNFSADDLAAIESFAKCVVKKDAAHSAEFAKMAFASMAQSQFFVTKVLGGNLAACAKNDLKIKAGMTPAFVARELWKKSKKRKSVPIMMAGRNPVENYALCFLDGLPDNTDLKLWSSELVGEARGEFLAMKSRIDPICSDKLSGKTIDPNSLLYALQFVTYNNAISVKREVG